MRTPALGLFLLTVLAAGSASAQLYKIVGPDGKISYSDRPPMEASAKVTVLKGGKAVPASAPASASVSASAAASAASAAPKDTMKVLAANPALVTGIATVLDISELVNQSLQSCAAFPNAKTYVAAKEAWTLRNGPILSHHRSVFDALYPAADQASLKKGIVERVGKTLEQVAGVNEASRIQWCDKSMEEVRSGKMDLASRDGIDALMAFKKP
jgi:hypothetical protein